jgi:SAM-dependent methyltransferase
LTAQGLQAEVVIDVCFCGAGPCSQMKTLLDVADRARVALADLIDLQMAPLGLAAMNVLGVLEGKTVLDVGCGTGQSTFQLAERTGTFGRVIGVDIAPNSLKIARSRTIHLPQVLLEQADAAHLGLPDHSVDVVYSRFGAMFFSDPVQAFGNLRRMLRPNGLVGFVCWRSIRENELDYLPLEASGLTLSEAPHVSFEQPSRIRNILHAAGFAEVAVDPFDAEVSCGDIDQTMNVVTQVGALGKALRNSPEMRSAVEPRVRAAITERVRGGQVGLIAATWVVTAHNTDL